MTPRSTRFTSPLPAALHGRRAAIALRAGKHVLVEKPFAANAEEAAAVAAVAKTARRTAMEAHYPGTSISAVEP
ncbi:Gfo/Idh/MocA family oxidoreductase [Jatrophihabitans endophyticus]|uniref:Gfo/Idh/MocA family oxidoreductase n=1 Tax=Jatrophihabitans endophyticus TaxID=1206085 RepID=UPI0019EF793E|nr:Gfo/Idh/MocA family oxidoreductase [Jatrophihabitans endophyticus]